MPQTRSGLNTTEPEGATALSPTRQTARITPIASRPGTAFSGDSIIIQIEHEEPTANAPQPSAEEHRELIHRLPGRQGNNITSTPGAYRAQAPSVLPADTMHPMRPFVPFRPPTPTRQMVEMRMHSAPAGENTFIQPLNHWGPPPRALFADTALQAPPQQRSNREHGAQQRGAPTLVYNQGRSARLAEEPAQPTHQDHQDPRLSARLNNTQWRPHEDHTADPRNNRDTRNDPSGQDTIPSRSQDTLVVDALQAIVQQLRAPTEPETLFTFSGLDHEDPALFLNRFEQRMLQRRVGQDDWPTHFARHLKDRASQWYRVYSAAEPQWDFVANRFLAKYDDSRKLNTLMAKLYGDSQSRPSDCDRFIMDKYVLARRLLPDLEDRDLAALIVQKMHPEIALHLEGRYFDNVDELAHAALRIESRLAESRATNSLSRGQAPALHHQPPPPRNPPGQRDRRNRRPSASNRPAPDRSHQPPQPCFTCRGNHWHADCPQRTQRNQRPPPRAPSNPQGSSANTGHDSTSNTQPRQNQPSALN
jgi:hypothetical protein